MKTVTIKSANGSVEDFKVDAELSWTVKELKGYIYRLYPTHPVSKWLSANTVLVITAYKYPSAIDLSKADPWGETAS